MRSRPFILLATCFASLTVFATSISAKPKVAVLGLEVSGDSAMDQKASEAAKALTRELRRAADRPGGAFDLAPNSGKDLLEMKLLSGCSDEGKRCMSDIGKQLRADRLIYGSLQRGKRGFKVQLRLLDTDKVQFINELDEVIPNGDMSAAGGVQRRARDLYGKLTGAGEEGALSISANTERGTIYVDGQIRTSLSAGSARVSGLSEGVHAVAIEAKGFERYETEVTIDAGENRNLRAKLTALEDEGSDVAVDGELDGGSRPGRGWRVAVWAGALGVVGGGAGWIYSGVTVRGEEKDIKDNTPLYNLDAGIITPDKDPQGNNYFKDSCESFKAGEMEGDSPNVAVVKEVLSSCDRAKRNRTLVNLVWIPATAAAVLFTSYAVYKGYIAPGKSSSEREAARKRRGKPRVTVMPAIGPNLVGAGLELEF